ncbi:MAG: response regulator, partial [Sphingomonadales bacterium]|nr:response regulator [Sphingomonadales bacterium]
MARSILVVDDEATQRRLLETVIKREGYQVLTAVDGDEAIEKLTGPSAITVDLVILDLSMPRVSGIEVLQKVRPRHPNLPIIVLTAHSNLANVVDAMKAGATDFLSKPASAERIRNAMASAFEKA